MSTDVGTVCRERRREACSSLVDIAVLRVETAVVVPRIVPVGNTRVTRGKDDTDTLQRQFHPFTALTLLVELRKGTFNLAVRNRYNVADRRTTALQRAGVGTWSVVGVRVGRINVRLISALISAVGSILRVSATEQKDGEITAYQGVQENVERSYRVNVHGVSILVQTCLLRPDDGVRGLEVQRTLNNLLLLCQ